MSGDCGAVGLWSMKGMDAETRTCREPPPPLDVAGETGEMIDVEVPTFVFLEEPSLAEWTKWHTFSRN